MIRSIVFLLLVTGPLFYSPFVLSQEEEQGKSNIGQLEDDLFFQLSKLQRLKGRYKRGKIGEEKYKQQLKSAYRDINQINRKMILNYHSFSDSSALIIKDSVILPEQAQAEASATDNGERQTASNPSQTGSKQSQAEAKNDAESAINKGSATTSPGKDARQQTLTSFINQHIIWIGVGIIGFVLLLLLAYFFFLTQKLASQLKYASQELAHRGESKQDTDEMERKLERLTGTLHYMATDLARMKTPVVRLEAPSWMSPQGQQDAQVPSETTAQKNGAIDDETNKKEDKNSAQGVDKESELNGESRSGSSEKDDTSGYPLTEQGGNGRSKAEGDSKSDMTTHEGEARSQPSTDTKEGKAVADDMDELGKLKDQYINKIFQINNLSVEANSLLHSLRKDNLSPDSKKAAEKKLDEINNKMKRLMQQDESE